MTPFSWTSRPGSNGLAHAYAHPVMQCARIAKRRSACNERRAARRERSSRRTLASRSANRRTRTSVGRARRGRAASASRFRSRPRDERDRRGEPRENVPNALRARERAAERARAKIFVEQEIRHRKMRIVDDVRAVEKKNPTASCAVSRPSARRSSSESGYRERRDAADDQKLEDVLRTRACTCR